MNPNYKLEEIHSDFLGIADRLTAMFNELDSKALLSEHDWNDISYVDMHVPLIERLDHNGKSELWYILGKYAGVLYGAKASILERDGAFTDTSDIKFEELDVLDRFKVIKKFIQ
jgi:hypothetical protein